MDPDYFLHRMQWYEVQLYMDGLSMRDHAGWEQARMTIHYILSGMGCKKSGNGNLEATDIIRLPWVDGTEEEASEKQEQQMKDLLHSMDEWNRAHS